MNAAASALTDCVTMTRRNLSHTLRSTDAIVVAIALPVTLLLLFVYVFGGAIDTGQSYLNYVVPGIIVLCASWGASTTALTVASDKSEGIVDRFRTMPIAPGSILMGHVLTSVVRNLGSTTIVVGVALIMGFRPVGDPLAWIYAAVLVSALVFAMSWLCATLGLLAGTPEAASGFTFGFLFLPYVSSAFVPAETMPGWLRGFAEHQPMTPVTETLRSILLTGSFGESAVTAFAWCAAIGIVGFVSARWVFGRRSPA